MDLNELKKEYDEIKKDEKERALTPEEAAKQFQEYREELHETVNYIITKIINVCRKKGFIFCRYSDTKVEISKKINDGKEERDVSFGEILDMIINDLPISSTLFFVICSAIDKGDCVEIEKREGLAI